MNGIFNLDSPLMSGLGKLCDIMWLNVLTLICCLPIVTIGPALTAMYYVTLKMVRNEEGYITRSYFESFKANFKQSFIIWIVMLAIIIIYILDYRILLYSGATFPKAFQIVLAALGIVLVFASVYIFPLQARFENTIKGTIKNAFLMSMMKLPKTILILIIFAIPIVLLLTVSLGVPIVTLFGIAGPGYLASHLFSGIFKKFEEEPEEVDPDSWTLEIEGEMEEVQIESTEEKSIEGDLKSKE